MGRGLENDTGIELCPPVVILTWISGDKRSGCASKWRRTSSLKGSFPLAMAL